MRVSRAQAEENRQAVITVASQLFREHGFNGIGLDKLMQAAGLTHGGFYKQFKSKDNLAVQACGRAFEESEGKWSRVIAKAADDPLLDLVNFYLSPRHRDHPGEGCAFAALGPDVARASQAALHEVFQNGIEAHLELLDGLLSKAPGKVTRDRSMAILAMMVGALILSRAVKDATLSRRFLAAATKEVTAHVTSRRIAARKRGA